MADTEVSFPARSRRRRFRSKALKAQAALPLLAFALAVAACLMALGGRAGGSVALALIVSLACVMLLRFVAPNATYDEARTTWAFRAGCIAWCATFFQLIPLPALWTHSGTEARALATVLGTDAPNWWPYSHSPYATTIALAKLSVFAFVFVLTRWVREASERIVLYTVCFLVALLWLVTLAHQQLAADHYFGVWPFPLYSVFPSPMLNSNHLAGLSMLTACLACGLAFSERNLVLRVGMALMAALFVAGGLLCVSRSGLLSLVVSVTVAALLGVGRAWRTRRKRIRAAPTGIGNPPALVARAKEWCLDHIASLAVVLTLSVVLVLAVYAGTDSLAAKIRNHDYRKIDVAVRAFALALDHPWLGVGRGAFSEAFVRIAGADTRFEYPENWLAQWTSEWGFPVALSIAALLLRAMMVAVSRAVSARKAALTIAEVAALAGLFAHDLFDFASEALATGAMASVLFALLEPRQNKTPTVAQSPNVGGNVSATQWKVQGFVSRWLADAPRFGAGFGLLTALGLIAVVYPHSGFRTSRAHYEHLDQQLQQASGRTYLSELARVALQYPAEPAFVVLRAKYAVLHNDVDAGRWLTLAMRSAPHWPHPHLLAATWLARSQRTAQAWLELRVAESLVPGSSGEIACALLQRWGARFVGHETDVENTDMLDQVIGTFAENLSGLDASLTSCTQAAEPLRIALEERLANRNFVPASLRVLARALTRPEQRVAALQTLQTMPPPQDPALCARREELMVLALAENGAWQSARERLQSRAVHQLRDAELATALRVFTQVRDRARMEACAEEMLGRCQGAIECVAGVHRQLADAAYESGSRGRALAEYDESNRLFTNEASLRRIVELAESLGQTTRRNRARDALCSLVDGRDSLCAGFSARVGSF